MCVPLETILAVHFYVPYNHLFSFFGTILALPLAMWQLLPACRSLLYHTYQIKISCPPHLDPAKCVYKKKKKKKKQGTLLRRHACSEVRIKRWSGSCMKLGKVPPMFLVLACHSTAGVSSWVLPAE